MNAGFNEPTCHQLKIGRHTQWMRGIHTHGIQKCFNFIIISSMQKLSQWCGKIICFHNMTLLNLVVEEKIYEQHGIYVNVGFNEDILLELDLLEKVRSRLVAW